MSTRENIRLIARAPLVFVTMPTRKNARLMARASFDKLLALVIKTTSKAKQLVIHRDYTALSFVL